MLPPKPLVDFINLHDGFYIGLVVSMNRGEGGGTDCYVKDEPVEFEK